MSATPLLRLATAAILAAMLHAPAFGQSERNGRLPPGAAAAPTFPSEAAPPALVPPPAAPAPPVTADTAAPASTAVTATPAAAAAAPPDPAVAVPAPRALPAPPAVAAPLALVPATTDAPSPPITSNRPPARVRMPLPAARAAAAVTAVLQAAPAAAATAEATVETAVDTLAAEAEALRTTAEQERAALAAPPALPRPAGRPVAGTEPEAEATAATAPAPAGPGDPATTVAGLAGAAAPVAVDARPEAAAPSQDGSPQDHDGAPVGTETVAAAAAAPADATAPAPAEMTAEAEPAAAADEADVTAPEHERPGGIRWIRGAGLPPPVATAPLDDADPADPEEQAMAAGGGAAADADGEGDAAASRPRTRRPPSGAPIASPYQLVRTLQAMQDDMAAGSTDALAAQRALLQRMEEEFANADPLVWQDRRNARALVTYTLGGGRPVTLRRLLRSETPPDGDEALMRGALAYVEGDEETARRYLVGVDARTLPASLGGQLAVAQAALLVGEDPKKAMALLDTARLLAPGTLVEEAALRRQIFVASELADLDRFEALASQYLRRFRRSVYAGNFRRRFASSLTRMTFLDDPAQFHRLDDMLAETDAEARRELYLVVAQAAVNAGKTTLAATAAERALLSAPPGSLDEARGRLYRGAALAVTREGFEAAMADLQAIEQRSLPKTDAALLQAASETAMLIETAASGTVPEAIAVAGGGAEEDETPSATVARARDAIAAVDALLEQAQ